MSSGMLHRVVSQKLADVLEILIATFMRPMIHLDIIRIFPIAVSGSLARRKDLEGMEGSSFYSSPNKKATKSTKDVIRGGKNVARMGEMKNM